MWEYPRSPTHATAIGPNLKLLRWPQSDWWSAGQRLPDFTFDFNAMIRSSQLPDAVACALLTSWVSEAGTLREELEDFMDALEWPEEASWSLLGPPAEAGGHGSGDGVAGRDLFALALRARLERLHMLMGDLHVGEGLRGAAAFLSQALGTLLSEGDAARGLSDEYVRREVDDVMGVILERIDVVVAWHREMAPRLRELGLMDGHSLGW